ncbi:MAG: UDP-N-acetylmuramoyl-L-alanine--D-glutamate ligase [Oscillospiraceae bacterium]|jgi:UDP-N-acetylmuramoylalanine--D-glutamate ligase|nr:UDP-N-acetylmuramoyl-L-alanine--D-glutamate ligase [Oscillospiraceae bacterium]
MMSLDIRRRLFKIFEGKKIVLLGIGRSNLAIAEILSSFGISFAVCDVRETVNLSSLKGANYSSHLGKNYLDYLECDLILRSPGFPFTEPALLNAKKNGTEVTSEIEIFFDLAPCKIIGITGSDGKTTTSTVIYEILRRSIQNVFLGGNIGQPLISRLFEIDETSIAIAELSSFQLISMKKSPDIAIITNISQNHLDVHKDFEEYVNSKSNILRFQNEDSFAILNFDDPLTTRFKKMTAGKTIFFSTLLKKNIYLENGTIYVNEIPALNIDQIKIPGIHNVKNFMAALGAVFACGKFEIGNIKFAAKEFSGVEHRIEFVREINGVKFFNDSVASSPNRTLNGALSVFNENIILIAGGYDKKLSYSEFAKVVCCRVKILILMGNTSKRIRAEVENLKTKNKLLMIDVKNMKEAVLTAKKFADNGDVVILSPASASFDLYKNFEERGIHFKKIVNKL